MTLKEKRDYLADYLTHFEYNGEYDDNEEIQELILKIKEVLLLGSDNEKEYDFLIEKVKKFKSMY